MGTHAKFKLRSGTCASPYILMCLRGERDSWRRPPFEPVGAEVGTDSDVTVTKVVTSLSRAAHLPSHHHLSCVNGMFSCVSHTGRLYYELGIHLITASGIYNSLDWQYPSPRFEACCTQATRERTYMARRPQRATQRICLMD